MFDRRVKRCAEAMCLTQESLCYLGGHPQHEAVVTNVQLKGELNVVLAEVEIDGRPLLANVKSGSLYDPDTRRSLSGLSTIIQMGGERKNSAAPRVAGYDHQVRDKTAARAAEMLAELRAGMSRAAIAVKFKCSYVSVCQNVKLATQLEAARAERKSNVVHA